MNVFRNYPQRVGSISVTDTTTSGASSIFSATSDVVKVAVVSVDGIA